ncbi:hypothetical protein, partial [Nocardia pseudovaccinii]|uniref:hypothetical protein n=1 Tax=Nocardia pseudovaccinii TaxID=189540 RepID=UPI001C3FBDA4
LALNRLQLVHRSKNTSAQRPHTTSPESMRRYGLVRRRHDTQPTHPAVHRAHSRFSSAVSFTATPR